ncbi:hypothetical protein HPB52_015728 [Rhipicephalus sanguineus]|uniref:Uncharacterized protein n=1 Tax=Rhipicephalus sanguineus TaxID=34632 RepID=A0A9D4PXW4_RHISA|nr:hypothetical protein HPB52_015728 [Rhipicephalus sanguineus]
MATTEQELSFPPIGKVLDCLPGSPTMFPAGSPDESAASSAEEDDPLDFQASNKKLLKMTLHENLEGALLMWICEPETQWELVQLVSSVREESEGANDLDTVEAPMPTPSQVMDAVNFLRRFAGAHEDAEDALISLASYENCVLPLLTKHVPAKITSFFTRQ